MMNEDLNKTINTYNQNQRNIYNAIRNTKLFDDFTKLCSTGSQYDMIELIIDIPQVRNIKITNCFACKNDQLAKNLLNKLQISGSSETDILESLNKALLATTVHTELYLKIMMERIRHWYKTKNLNCLKDIKYVTDHCKSYESCSDLYLECKIECYLLENQVHRTLQQPEDAKIALNKAMAELNNLAEKTCKSNRNLKQTKQELLQTFLKKLKKGKDLNCTYNSINNKKIMIPKPYGRAHNLLKCCSDSVSLGYTKAKGRYLYAVKDIPIGSTIIVDPPFSHSINKDVLHSNCLHCFTSLSMGHSAIIPCSHCQTVIFCSEECRGEAWAHYHEYECSVFSLFYSNEYPSSHLLLAYRATFSKLLNKNRQLNTEFFDDESNSLQLRNERSKEELSGIYDPLEYKTVSNLQSHSSETSAAENLIHAVRSVFFLKCLEFVLNAIADVTLSQDQRIVAAAAFLRHIQIINCNAYEIVENVYNGQKQIWEPRNVGGAIYATVSLTNHSCYPNIVRHSYPGGTVVVRTTRMIKSGDEILDNYGPHFLTNNKTQRQEYLQRKYHFTCCCIACENDWPSDLAKQETKFKCSLCSQPHSIVTKKTKCQCEAKLNVSSIKFNIQDFVTKRLTALSLMLENNYEEALVLLLKHLSLIENLLSSPNIEIIKTQQAIIQCYNSMSCVRNKNYF